MPKYDSITANADRNSFNEIRRSTTQLELACMADRGDFDFEPDPLLIKQHCLRIMMHASNIIDRCDGTDFAPNMFARAAQC